MAWTTFSSGANTSFSSQLNANFNELIQYKVITAAAEQTSTGTTYASVSSTNLSVNGYTLIGIHALADVKQSEHPSYTCKWRISITGSTLGTYYTACNDTSNNRGSGVFLYKSTDTAPYGDYLATSQSTSYVRTGASIMTALPCVDATTTVSVDFIGKTAGTGTGYIQNIQVILIFARKTTAM